MTKIQINSAAFFAMATILMPTGIYAQASAPSNSPAAREKLLRKKLDDRNRAYQKYFLSGKVLHEEQIRRKIKEAPMRVKPGRDFGLFFPPYMRFSKDGKVYIYNPGGLFRSSPNYQINGSDVCFTNDIENRMAFECFKISLNPREGYIVKYKMSGKVWFVPVFFEK
ncbi:hypothetical protein [Novosphingobium mangrovi (ex Hu et al. 2023)]|uniref:Uncharacterized protein n=1 Tax=Novosphingobium mangrovi (ex Hu et al. 2023) TaxID=2930094 RepID=A0ABT0ACS1_9SPHN|nr:hypothetical protein [Novosphingobium mangrovi (ex Hu et al. 2023)]MCJ1960987.1 hypothetical protein [Novosphingobium mangrovi (ex Hu et al. 2023)]